MSTPPSPSPTNTPISPLANTSNLLFGFLVSALSIFAIFMTFAIVWNRLVARRRAIDAMLASSPPLDSQRLLRPTMWDVWAVSNKQPPSWLDIKPVAAQKCDSPASPSRTTQTEQTISFWRQQMLNRVPPEITYLFHRPIPQVSSASSDATFPIELSHGSDIQVSLLISMPHAPQSMRQGEHEDRQTFPEMVFATTNVLFHDSSSS